MTEEIQPSTIASKAHEQFGLLVPQILTAKTDEAVAEVLRPAIRDNASSPLADKMLRFLNRYKLKGVYDNRR